MLDYVAKINKTAPLESRTDSVPGNDMDGILKRMGLWGMSFQGATINGTKMVFRFRLADTLDKESRYALMMGAPVVQMTVIEKSEKLFGEENNPFRPDFLKAVSKSKIKWILSFEGKNGVSADIIVAKSGLPIPYEETPNDKVTMVDGYPAVKIGKQIWMAENLNVETPGSRCYDDNAENCEMGGRLYTIDEARGICPDGWHLPDTAEFKVLLKEVGDARKLLSANYDEWSKNYVGTDDYGFRLRPAGKYDGSFQEYSLGHVGKNSSGVFICFNCVRSYLWASTVPQVKMDEWNHKNLGYYLELPASSPGEENPEFIRLFAARDSVSEKTAFSVRCLK